MTIYGLDNVGSRGGQTTAKSSESLGKNDFLQMLVVQLQNINTSLTGIGTSQAVLTHSQAVEFIGKQITAVGDTTEVAEGGSGALQFSLNGEAAGVFVNVYDAGGNFVRNMEFGAMASGEQSVSWDGRDSRGNAVADGTYRFTVEAVNADNQPVSTVTFAQGTVTGVNYRDGQAYLITGNQEIPMGNVVKVVDGAPA